MFNILRHWVMHFQVTNITAFEQSGFMLFNRLLRSFDFFFFFWYEDNQFRVDTWLLPFDVLWYFFKSFFFAATFTLKVSLDCLWTSVFVHLHLKMCSHFLSRFSAAYMSQSTVCIFLDIEMHVNILRNITLTVSWRQLAAASGTGIVNRENITTHVMWYKRKHHGRKYSQTWDLTLLSL